MTSDEHTRLSRCVLVGRLKMSTKGRLVAAYWSSLYNLFQGRVKCF